MSTGYIFNLNGVGESTDFTVRAVAQFGDNDGTGGDDELLLGGEDPSDYAGGQLTWNPDTNNDGSWNSDWVPVQLTLAAGGGADGVQFNALGGNPGTLVDSSESYGDITGVNITAAAQVQGTFAWSDVRVTFGTASNPDADTYEAASGPAVDTTGDDPNNASAEQALNVSTSVPDVTRVTVTGNVRMSSSNGPYLNTADLFGEVLVYTAGHS